MPERVFFSDFWKVSLVFPEIKKVEEGCTAKKCNPVSFLFVVSYVFENLVNNKIVDHLEKCSVFF